jgi:hypothetical protein
MKRFILHVGLHKTATSSIQQTLARNADNLTEQGYHYPIFEFEGRQISNHSIPFYSAYCEHPKKYNINIMNGYGDRIELVNAHYMQQIDNIMLINKHVILSGEDISALPQEALEIIRDKIILNGFKLEVYCSVRQPYSFLCSELQERIKAGISTLDNITVPKKSMNIEKLKNVFDASVAFSSFEADCEKGNPVNVFLQRIGVNTNGLEIVSNNEGLGNITTRLYAHLNATHPIVSNGKINEKGRKRFLNNFDEGKFLLTKDEYQSIEDELVKESSRIGEILDESYIDPTIKFTEEFTINRALAENIYNDIKQDGLLSLPILEFVKKHRDFEIFDLLLSQNVELIKDMTLICSRDDTASANEFIEKANANTSQKGKIGSVLSQINQASIKDVSMIKKEPIIFSNFREFLLGNVDFIKTALRERLTYFIPETTSDIINYDQLTDALFYLEYIEKDKKIFINLLRDISVKIENKSIINSFRLMALAKILRPGGEFIISKFAFLEKKLLDSLTIGIGVISYNRLDLVKDSIQSINKYTTGNYHLIVADDGSNDGTAEWCSQNSTICVSGKNKGVVWNKNRALYYLNTVLKCDVTILVEDDCLPDVKGWQIDWVLSAILWGHINFAHNRIIKKPDAVISGDGSYLSPFIAKLVTGQCTACSSSAIQNVGYLNSRFIGYGAGHVEWTERFIFHGYNGLRGGVDHVFPAINKGVTSNDAPTYKDKGQLERNKKLKMSLKQDNSFKLPWKDDAEKSEFLSEIDNA